MVLADGTYEVIVVDAADVEDADVESADVEDADVGTTVRLELAIVTGPSKGDVVVVRAEHLPVSAVEALGLPGRLVVTDRQPEVVLET